MIRALEKLFLAGALAAGVLSGAPALAQQYIGGDLSLTLDESDDVRILAADVTATGTVLGGVSILAADVSLDADIAGDVEIAAADVSVDGRVGGDVSLAAADITLDADVAGDAEIAGADVGVSGVIGGEAEIAGAFVLIGDDAAIEGEASIAAREVHVRGRLAQGGEIRGREVYLEGVIEGPVEIRGREVWIEESAVISGPITVRSPRAPEVAPGAQVGELTHIEEAFDERSLDRDFSFDIGGWPAMGVLGGVFAASAFVLGMLVSLLAPESTGRIAACFRARPWVSGFLGLVVLATLPVIVLTLITLLAVTVIGIPLAVLLVLALPIVFFLAFAFGGIVIGDLALNRSGDRAGLGLRVISLLVALVAIVALSAVPILGFFILPAVLCIGLGAWTLAIFQRQNRNGGGDSAPAAAAEPDAV
ncbi:MAG: hypothetical protein ABL308_12125 [Oceanicaulis sp.]